MLDFSNLCDIISNADAALAHLVERHLAKVEVASSSLVGRSTKPIAFAIGFFICGYGGIGRHAGFRFPWETVQVQVLLPAPNQYNPNLVFPVGDGFGLFIFFGKFEDTHFRNGVIKRLESKPRGSRKKKQI